MQQLQQRFSRLMTTTSASTSTSTSTSATSPSPPPSATGDEERRFFDRTSSEDADVYVVKVRSVGQTVVYGISSSYDCLYPEDQLAGLVSQRDYEHIMDRLNDTILSYWPCTFAFCCTSLLFVPFALFFTKVVGCKEERFCMQAEREARKLLEQYSLRAVFFDNGVTVSLQKTLCKSWVEFRFPMGYVRRCRADAGVGAGAGAEAAVGVGVGVGAGAGAGGGGGSSGLRAATTVSAGAAAAGAAAGAGAGTATGSSAPAGGGMLVSSGSGTHSRYERKME